MPVLWVDIPQMLIDAGVVSNLYAARTTSNYALMWSQGAQLDFSKSSTNLHRARLRKIGIDIKKPYQGELYSLEDSRSIIAQRNSIMS